MDGVPPDLSPQQTFHILVSSLRCGYKIFLQLGNGGYIFRHAHAHQVRHDKIINNWSLRSMIQECASAVTFAPVDVRNHAFKQIDGVVYARR